MVVLSDLHNSEFGAYNSELVDKVRLFGLLLPAHPGGPCGSRTAHLRSGFPLSGGAQPAGGTENISSVAHCMIRLRFAVKDLNKADQEALKKIPGVLSVTPAA